MLQERDNRELQAINYILYGNEKSIWRISNTSIQLVWTCLVLNWNKDKKVSSIYLKHLNLLNLFEKKIINFFFLSFSKYHI